MSTSRARYLMDQLFRNSLSKEELDELLEALGNEQMATEYTDILEKYFYNLLNEGELTDNQNSKDRN